MSELVERVDKDGLPTNLSPLEPRIMGWADQYGVHLVFFNKDVWDQIPPGGNINDFIKYADYVITLPPAGAIRTAQSLLGGAMKLLDHGVSTVFDFKAPHPIDPEARHRIWARDHDRTLESMENGGLEDENSGMQAPYHDTRPPVPEDHPVLRQVRDLLGDGE